MAKARRSGGRKTAKRPRAGRVVKSKSGRTYRKGQSGKWVQVSGHKRGGPNKRRKGAKRKGARRRTRSPSKLRGSKRGRELLSTYSGSSDKGFLDKKNALAAARAASKRVYTDRGTGRFHLR